MVKRNPFERIAASWRAIVDHLNPGPILIPPLMREATGPAAPS